MDAIEAITQRVSCAKLTGPDISEHQLSQLMAAAARAPDHAQLKPTRFIAVRGEHRQTLGEVALASMQNENQTELSAEKADKLRALFLRAPLVLVAVCRLREHPKVPRDEQVLSSGAAVQNVMNMAYALGLGAIWRTGEVAYASGVHKELGLNEYELLVGYLYIGHRNTPPRTAPNRHNDSMLSEYHGRS